MTSANARLVLAFVAIFLLALAPRLAVALQFDDSPAMTNDAGWYDFFGVQIADGHGYSLPFGETTSRWPPGYPYFLGTVYKLTGDSRTAARVAQALLGAGTAVLAAEVARRVIGLRTGIATGAIVALLPGHVLWTSILMSEVLFTFLLAAAFAIGVHARSNWAMAAAPASRSARRRWCARRAQCSCSRCSHGGGRPGQRTGGRRRCGRACSSRRWR